MPTGCLATPPAVSHLPLPTRLSVGPPPLCPAPWSPSGRPSLQVGAASPCPKPTLCPSPLQYACGVQAEVVGKPSPEFFKSALREMGVEAPQVGRPRGAHVGQRRRWGSGGSGSLVSQAAARPGSAGKGGKDGIGGPLRDSTCYMSVSLRVGRRGARGFSERPWPLLSKVKDRKVLSVQRRYFVGKTTHSQIEKMHEIKPRFLPPLHDGCFETVSVLNIRLKKTKSSSDFSAHGAPPPEPPRRWPSPGSVAGETDPGGPAARVGLAPGHSVARPVPWGRRGLLAVGPEFAVGVPVLGTGLSRRLEEGGHGHPSLEPLCSLLPRLFTDSRRLRARGPQETPRKRPVGLVETAGCV